MPPNTDILHTLMAIVTVVVWLCMFMLVLVMGPVHWRRIRGHLKAGLWVGLLCVAMQTPATILAITCMDVDQLAARFGAALPDKEMAVFFVWIGVVLGIGLLALKVFWYAAVYHVAASEWEQVNPDALPVLRRTGRKPWVAILMGLLFGVAAGCLSAVVFAALGADASDSVKELLALFPGLESVDPLVYAPAMFLTVAAIAVAEELLFRGALFGLMVRIGRNNCLVVVVSAVVVSLLWAVMHYENSNMPLLKMGQIFALGLAFCAFARRGRIEIAIAAHVGLNVAAVAAALAIA